MGTAKDDIRHLYLRAGFGENPQWLRDHQDRALAWHVDRLFEASRGETPLATVKDPTKGHKKEVGKFKLGVIFVRSRKELKQLNLTWLDQMGRAKEQLREKMTLFWHDHFATHVPIAYLMQLQNNTLRHHALGSFREMLHAVAKDPAMLIYLNNQQNKKGHPNENFAREVMELFTVGRGNYTENDIKEAARAFTGWQVNAMGQYEFRPRIHDDGEKAILGQRGKWSGEEVLDILLEQKATASHICRKLYAYFVQPTVDEGQVAELADVFFSSDYDISAVLRHMFAAPWFYAEQHRGALVKSPVELLVHYQRLLRMDMRQEQLLLLVQKALGQILFFPPNVGGWPNGLQWIDSSSLMLRMKLPMVIFGADQFELSAKPDPEAQATDISERKIPRFAKAKVEWKHLAMAVSGVAEDQLPQALTDILLTGPRDRVSTENLLTYADRSSKTAFIQSLCIRIMALPEFQLK